MNSGGVSAYQRLRQIFREADFLARPPDVYFKGKSKYSTGFGAILTIFCFVFFIIFLLYFLRDFVERSNPEILYSDDIYLKPKVYEFSTKQNPIMISLYNAEFEYTRERKFFHAKLAQEIISDKKTKLEFYEMESCTEDHFSGVIDAEVRKEYMSLNLSEFLCAPNNLTLSVRGSLIDEVLSSLKMFFYSCKNSSDEATICETPEKMHRQLRSGYLVLYWLDFYVDKIKNLHSQISYIKKIVCTFDYRNSRHINVYLKWTEVMTNDHPILNTERVDSFINFDSLQDYNIEAQEFFQYHILLTTNKHVYRRRFKKLQDVLASVGGVMNVILFLVTCLYKLYTNLLFKVDLINSSFAIEFSDGRRYDPGGDSKPNPGGDSKLNPRASKRGSKRKSELHASYFLYPNKNCSNQLKKEIPSIKTLPEFAIELKEASKISGHPKSPGDLDSDLEPNYNHPGQQLKFKESQGAGKIEDQLQLDSLDYICYYSGLFCSEKRKEKMAALEKTLQFLALNAGIENIIKNDYEIRRIKSILNIDSKESRRLKTPLILDVREVEEK